jgi:archaellum component FlaC
LVDDEITGVISDVNALMTRTNGLPGRLTNLQNTGNAIEGAVGEVQTTVDNVQGKVEDVQSKVGDVQDKIADISETVRNQKDSLTDDLLDLISESLEELKTLAAEQREGLAEFRGTGDDCSSAECIQFKSDITELFTNMQGLSNTLLDQGVELEVDVDFGAVNQVLDLLPASGLYPIYLATTREVNLFDSGLAELIAQMDADMRAVSGEEDEAGGLPSPLSCEAMLARPAFFSKATDSLFAGGGAVRLLGKIVGATATTGVVEKDIQTHGYAGLSIESNYRQMIGNIL